MNSPAEPKMSGSFEQLNANAFPANKTTKEPGHPCSGEGKCCGGCRNPKRPVAAISPLTEPKPQAETPNTSAASSSL